MADEISGAGNGNNPVWRNGGAGFAFFLSAALGAGTLLGAAWLVLWILLVFVAKVRVEFLHPTALSAVSGAVVLALAGRAVLPLLAEPGFEKGESSFEVFFQRMSIFGCHFWGPVLTVGGGVSLLTLALKAALGFSSGFWTWMLGVAAGASGALLIRHGRSFRKAAEPTRSTQEADSAQNAAPPPGDGWSTWVLRGAVGAIGVLATLFLGFAVMAVGIFHFFSQICGGK